MNGTRKDPDNSVDESTNLISRTQLRLASATDSHHLAAEASDLGFAPGAWPRWIADGQYFFNLVSFDRDAEGEITAARYETGGGIRLVVFND